MYVALAIMYLDNHNHRLAFAVMHELLATKGGRHNCGEGDHERSGKTGNSVESHISTQSAQRTECRRISAKRKTLYSAFGR